MPGATVWTNAVPCSQSPPKPGTRCPVGPRTSLHINTESSSVEDWRHQTHGQQPLCSRQSSHHCRKASACAFLPWVQRVTSCFVVVQSSFYYCGATAIRALGNLAGFACTSLGIFALDVQAAKAASSTSEVAESSKLPLSHASAAAEKRPTLLW